MTDIEYINIKEYDYYLPEERIAQFPLKERSKSRLLVYRNGEINHTVFEKITSFLPENSFLVFNNTKVINARLLFHKKTGAKIEIFCLEPSYGKPAESAFSSAEESYWNCLVGNASKWADEILEMNFNKDGAECILYAEKILEGRENFIIRFSWNPGNFTFSEILHSTGLVPLPPYIKRKPVAEDSDTYQTVYAKIEGSVAAPTAGLHFNQEIMNELKERNIKFDYVSLNVGAGTFKPVKSENAAEHKMHFESFCIPRSFIQNLYENSGKNITAVGTTSVRTLESLYWLGALPDKIKKGNCSLTQWEVYDYRKNSMPDLKSVLGDILEYLNKENAGFLYGSTELMIVPGYRFRVTDSLITNFHLPRSTLLLLVSAFTGKDWRKIYDYALANGFRFLSYGDSSIIIKNKYEE
ncbi:MAG: S-adenosylmethionine:tRNA ribosyltransferase-isomerase [Ignavibacteria bacterium]|jgi:S-adenosylmethionine:tRNA ribosyltransferase-isomerase|nr:S-adenosylmethionine:tRNA ribosyltransferase-isomerase [Ignavibacteria bacterium]